MVENFNNYIEQITKLTNGIQFLRILLEKNKFEFNSSNLNLLSIYILLDENKSSIVGDTETMLNSIETINIYSELYSTILIPVIYGVGLDKNNQQELNKNAYQLYRYLFLY